VALAVTTLGLPARAADDAKGVAFCVTQKGSILHREKPESQWQLVDQKEALKAGDLLLGWPGGVLESGNQAVSLSFLTDFGDSPFPVVECAVVLHETKDFDLDVTLDRGRADITNTKAKGSWRSSRSASVCVDAASTSAPKACWKVKEIP